jgi:hypothetical protein
MEAVHLDSEMTQIGPQLLVSRQTGCAVKRRWSTARVYRPEAGSLHPVAIGQQIGRT